MTHKSQVKACGDPDFGLCAGTRDTKTDFIYHQREDGTWENMSRAQAKLIIAKLVSQHGGIKELLEAQ